ncbi:alpha/beta hydrolase [Streptomyces sp. NPDC049577]|uniref:alpha/beta hydrolase family protein n=1 Tax=Streptomyces sp. NPDC049577 TaxID=3155153 RepID=UPI00341E4396
MRWRPAAATSAAEVARAGHAQGRGTLLAVSGPETLTAGQVKAFLSPAEAPFDTSSVRYGIRAYRLTYRTVTPQGAPTVATGLFVLPDGGPRRPALVADTHGTMANRDYAPSHAIEDPTGRMSPYLHASAGRAVAAPDYLGLGDGPGRHPYMDTASAVTASVDMLRASRTAAGRLGRPLTGDVYATGFSQGGQVSMALAKALQAGADRHFRLRAAAPIAGPYDLEHAEMPAVFDGRLNGVSAVFYLSYYLTSQNRLHPIYKDPAEVFRQPYAGIVEGLFDTRHKDEDIVRALPPTPKELLTDAFYARLQHPTGVLLDVMRAQDTTCDWKPEVPVRLHASAGDRDVTVANTLSCVRDLERHGVRVPVVDHGRADHFGTFREAAPQIARWFNELEGTRP